MNLTKEKTPTSQVDSILHTIPLPMQYLGGKGRIIDEILTGIESKFGKSTTFIDLFAGSGIVSYHAMMKGYQVLANDIQPYSASVLTSLLTYPTNNLKNLISLLENISEKDLFHDDRRNYRQEYLIEKSFISSLNENLFDWKKYKKFCDSVILCNGQEKYVKELQKKEKWTLFLAYYRNTYFGVRQCAEIDYLKELSEQLDIDLKGHLIASVVSSLTYCVSSTTHLAQYLKPSTEINAENLLKRRNYSIIRLVLERLKALNTMIRPISGKVFNSDFRKALKEMDINSSTVIYADPPYFKEHYSRYYHILDTFVLYDYPTLTYNSRIEGTTIGRYRENRITSDFGKKSLVRSAFNDLCDLSIRLGNKLAVSYASSSIVEKEFFFNMANEKNLNLSILEFNIMHTGQGQARHKNVIEYLFLYSTKKY